MTVPTLVSASQWTAAEIQVLNWGGFQGHHRMVFATGCTLLTGASGSGKSTLLDAVIADLMPHTIPFNGASNEAVGGPVRGGQQRSIVTYLRGKRDTAADGEDGKLTDRVLRGDGEPAWGAIALTFVNGDLQRFSVLRTYFVPAGATGKGDVTERRFTVPGEFDLRDVANLRAGAFPPEAMRNRFPGLKNYGSYAEFQQAFCTRLGIGQADTGIRALRLLARIQAAHPLTTVDQLYKSMVLEDPGTLARADECLAHFATLEQSYRDLETAEDKEQALRAIHDLYTKWVTATDNADHIDTFGANHPSVATPFLAWRLRHLRRLLDAAEREVKQLIADATHSHTVVVASVAELRQQRSEIERQKHAAGGDLLGVIEGRLEVANSELARAEARLEILVRDTIHLGGEHGALFATKDSFAAAVAAAREFTASYETEQDRLTVERDALVAEAPTVQAKIEELTAELRSLAERDGLVPRAFHDARKEIANACALKVADLPFTAELIDVDSQYEDWRLAAELTLGGIGLTMLVDERRQDHVRRSINDLRLGRRIRFEGVTLGTEAPGPLDELYISGRLVFKEDSPYIGWVKARVAREGTDHLCVADASDLGGPVSKVTITGQTSQQRRGAHGRNPDQRFILGFSNEARKEEVRSELRRLQVKRDQIREGQARLTALLSKLDTLKLAHNKVMSAEWELIDVTGLRSHTHSLEAQRWELLAKSDQLAALAARLVQVETELDVATKEKNRVESDLDALNGQWGEIQSLQDTTTDELTPIEQAGLVTLSDEDDAFLQAKLAEQDPEIGWEGFDKAASRLRARLGEESKREREAAKSAQDHLESVFAQYNKRWPDPNRGVTIDAYRDYADIYDEIIRDGLHTRKQRFKREVQEWSGQDLRLLSNAFDQAREEIDGRMDPVNRFLAAVPFGPRAEKLQIVLRDLHQPDVDSFRARLRALASDTTRPLTEEEVHERFVTLRDFMKSLGWSEGGVAKRSDDLLDVRRHVKVTARRIDSDGREAGVYESLAGKSGGESQELAAFIVGAALRYQLGDGDRPEPRFAPVFLDEGFVKSDWEYAGRAVQAWRRLGFQLIVSAPLDKVTGLEPHMQRAAVVTKNLEHGYSFITEFPDMEAWAQHKPQEVDS